MKVGDLVMLKSHCKNGGKFAIISEVPRYLKCVKIMFIDTFECISALTTNLILLSEGSESIDEVQP